MKNIMRLFILALIIGCVWQPGVAGTVAGTEGKKCYPTTYSGSSGGLTISVFGDFIENIDRARAPSGVTVTIISKENGAQNNSGPFAGKGKVSLNIKTNNASPGNKTISLINDPPLRDTYSFTIAVITSPQVTSVDIPAPVDPFKEITVTFHGTGLQQANVNQNTNANITVSSGGVVVSSILVLSSSPTSLKVKINFYARVEEATVDLFFDSDNDCAPLGISPLKKSVHVKKAAV